MAEFLFNESQRIGEQCTRKQRQRRNLEFQNNHLRAELRQLPGQLPFRARLIV